MKPAQDGARLHGSYDARGPALVERDDEPRERALPRRRQRLALPKVQQHQRAVLLACIIHNLFKLRNGRFAKLLTWLQQVVEGGRTPGRDRAAQQGAVHLQEEVAGVRVGMEQPKAQHAAAEGVQQGDHGGAQARAQRRIDGRLQDPRQRRACMACSQWGVR